MNLLSATPIGSGSMSSKRILSLSIALLALLIGNIVLWLEISEYGGFGNIKGPSASLAPINQPLAA